MENQNGRKNNPIGVDADINVNDNVARTLNCVSDLCKDVLDMLSNLPDEKLRQLEVECISDDIQDFASESNKDESIVADALIDAAVCYCMDRIYSGYKGDIDAFVQYVRSVAEEYGEMCDLFDELSSYDLNELRIQHPNEKKNANSKRSPVRDNNAIPDNVVRDLGIEYDQFEDIADDDTDDCDDDGTECPCNNLRRW